MYQKNKKIQSKKNTKSHKNIINIIDLHAYLQITSNESKY